MSTITDKIISAGIELGEQIAGNISNWQAQEQAMREMIAAALADARREGAEAMREAVRLTDEQVQHVAHTVSNRFLGGGGLAEDQGHDWDGELSRAIESAVLAANNLEVRRG